MPFFWQAEILKTNKSKKNKPSLREINPDSYFFIAKGSISTFLKKRVSSFIFRNKMNGSATVEASFVVPFFLFAVFSLISVTDMFRIKGCIDVAVAETGNRIALESYLGYSEELITPFYIKNKICMFLKENLSPKDYQKVKDGIKVTNLSFLEEKNILSFQVKYKWKPQFDMLGFVIVNLQGNYYGHNWLGYQGESEIEPMVFLSDNAEVYHVSKNCKYLNVTIMEISKKNLEKYRNNDGSKYKPCSFCESQNETEIIYITPEGNNYHGIKQCIGLTRYIYTVPKSKAGDKRVCTGCGE